MRRGRLWLVPTLGSLVVIGLTSTAIFAQDGSSPSKPASLPADGPCNSVCKTDINLKYILKSDGESKTFSYTEKGGGKKQKQYWVAVRDYWWPIALCGTTTVGDTKACGSDCRFENLPVIWTDSVRDVEEKCVYEETTEEAENASTPVTIKLPPKTTRTLLYSVLSPTPWRAVGSGKSSDDDCWCIGAGDYNWDGMHPGPNVPPGTPTPPGGSGGTGGGGGGGGGTPTASDPPADLFAAPGSWPTRCTNKSCQSTGAMKYTSSLATGSTSKTHDVWGGEWSSAVPPEPIYVSLTHNYVTSATVTWTADSKEANCKTQLSTSNGRDPTAHSKPCASSCEFEAVPDGTCTGTTTRSCAGVHFTYTTTSKSYTLNNTTYTITKTLPIEFTYSMTAWGAITMTAFTGTKDKCTCVPATATVCHNPPDPSATLNDPEYVEELNAKKKQEEKEKSTETPPADTGR